MRARAVTPDRIEGARRDAAIAARVADLAARARAAQPPRDPTGQHHATIANVARRSGRDVGHLLNIFDERAAVREYDGATSRADAEHEAAREVEATFAPKQAILPWEGLWPGTDVGTRCSGGARYRTAP